MIEFTNVTHSYSKKASPAVSNLNFKVEDGEVFGFLGPNGAGKSTTIKLLCGILQLAEGDIKVDGHSMKTESLAAKKLLAYCPDEPNFFKKLTGRRYVNFLADIYGVPQDVRDERLAKYAARFDITGALDKKLSSYSHGMAQKLSELYAAGSDNYAAIIKFAANDATLAGADAADAGNWSNLYDTFVALLEKQIADYASLGYEVNVVGMYWIQGEKDVAHVAAYESALNALIDNVREDLSDITGADLSNMPVVIGEIATFLNLKTSDAHTAFVAQQNEMASTENNVIVDPTSLYMADANGVFTTPSELVSIGARVAATLVKNGISAIDPATVEIPAVEFVADIIVAGSEPTSVTSIAMALAVAPNGSTIKLNVDLDLQATINLDGINGITLDGNGKTISVNFDDMAFTLKNSNVVFHNIKLTHNGANVGFKLDNDAKLFLTGSSTNVVTNLTAFELTGKNAQLVITDGSFKTTNESALGAIIHTNNGDVEINGGIFEAAAGTSCIVVDRNAPSRLAVDIAGGSFKTTAAGSAQPAAFVNECPVAILVIDPTVVIDAGATINKGVSE